jgi:pimeloyl-ACP methyl ester carboxylesterase
MDCSATFQFIVDELRQTRPICALDWRGFGLSDRTTSDSYWFPDYLADLDQLLVRLSPDAPVDVVAHSMGGNVALMYAGVRPDRIRRIVNLEGLGLGATRSSQAPGRYRQWLDELREGSPRNGRAYPTLEALADRLMQSNRRLTPERALFVAQHWSRPRDDGHFEILGDPAHKRVNPVLYRVPEVQACWRNIRASVLWVMAAEQPANRWHADDSEVQRRVRAIRSLQRVTVEDSGHMLHHDQPAAIARLIEDFLR